MSLQNGVLGAFGLDFGGLGPPFWRVRASFSKALDVIFGTTNAKNAQKPAKTKAPSQGGQTAKVWVGSGDPPRGVSIRRPPKVCRACWIQTTSLTTKAPDPTTNGQAPDGKLKFLDQGSYTPLFFSPQEPGDHRRPCAKKRKNGTLSLFFSIFCPSKLQSKFCIEKTSKKVGKSRILASQTPPKTKPKSF